MKRGCLSVYVPFIMVRRDSRGRKIQFCPSVFCVNRHCRYFCIFFVRTDVENSFDQELRSYEFVSPQLHNRWKSKRDISTRSTSVSESNISPCLCNFTALSTDI